VNHGSLCGQLFDESGGMRVAVKSAIVPRRRGNILFAQPFRRGTHDRLDNAVARTIFVSV
jgi:hypothetical protein